MKLTWQHIVLVAILLAASVVSRVVPNPEDRTLVLIVTAVLAAFMGPAAVIRSQTDRLDNIEEATKQVQRQTNGVLDQRIAETVRGELQAAGLIPADQDQETGTEDVAY